MEPLSFPPADKITPSGLVELLIIAPDMSIPEIIDFLTPGAVVKKQAASILWQKLERLVAQHRVVKSYCIERKTNIYIAHKNGFWHPTETKVMVEAEWEDRSCYLYDSHGVYDSNWPIKRKKQWLASLKPLLENPEFQIAIWYRSPPLAQDQAGCDDAIN